MSKISEDYSDYNVLALIDLLYEREQAALNERDHFKTRLREALELGLDAEARAEAASARMDDALRAVREAACMLRSVAMSEWTKKWAEQGGARTALSWWERACAGETMSEIAADHEVDVRVVAYALAGYAAGSETARVAAYDADVLTEIENMFEAVGPDLIEAIEHMRDRLDYLESRS